jgi:hypothetical protein
MRTIKILGTGCAKCKQTEAVIREALDEMGIDASVESAVERRSPGDVCIIDV